jgi:hypothetical protein
MLRDDSAGERGLTERSTERSWGLQGLNGANSHKRMPKVLAIG